MTRLVLAGNGGFANRGCEAIERGTLAVLRASLEAPSFLVAPFGDEPEAVDCGPDCERVARRFYGDVRFSPQWLVKNAALRAAPKWAHRRLFSFEHLDAEIRGADVLLQLGGDNFSLDYGGPEPFLALNQFALERGCPVVIWGGSVGPFGPDASYEAKIIAELSGVNLFLCRETRTRDYLAAAGLGDKVELVADPAFAMAPVDPATRGIVVDVPSGSVGLNISPLYARYTGTSEDWPKRCANVAESIARATGRPLVLVPHVVVPSENDHDLLAVISQLLAERGIEAPVLPAELSAPELKWAIGRMSLFVGTRTHATIAALSQGVPTISLAYSVKAYGINVDLLGTDEYVVPAVEFGPERIEGVVRVALAREDAIREQLATTSDAFRHKAFSAGEILRERLGLR